MRTAIMVTLAFFWICLESFGSGLPASIFTIEKRDGSNSIKGKVLAIEGEGMKILRDDGKTFVIPFSDIHTISLTNVLGANHAYVRNRVKEDRAATARQREEDLRVKGTIVVFNVSWSESGVVVTAYGPEVRSFGGGVVYNDQQFLIRDLPKDELLAEGKRYRARLRKGDVSQYKGKTLETWHFLEWLKD